ncbi:MAG: DUF4382 domain-containing protein [Gammaproteobacteria bacterium]|nr:DUF4382 domain-containing protein [Gammaproteobacteria bacterium]
MKTRLIKRTLITASILALTTYTYADNSHENESNCGFDNVYVTVQELAVNANSTASDSDAGWQILSLNAATKIDILSQTVGVLAQLGQPYIPQGNYRQIRLIIKPSDGSTLVDSVVPTSSFEQPLATPSSATSGYKIFFNTNFTVQPNTDFVLDLDPCHSIVHQGNGLYLLKPVTTAVQIVGNPGQ